jgi:hypothetical protein
MNFVHHALLHTIASAIAVSAFTSTAMAQETRQTQTSDSPQPASAARDGAPAETPPARAADSTEGTEDTPAAPAEATAELPPDPHRGDVQRTVGWTLCGAGAAAVAIGGAFAVVAKSEHDDAATETGAARYATSQEASGFANTAAFWLVAGGAAVASGAIVWLTAPRTHTSIGTNGRELLVRGTF